MASALTGIEDRVGFSLPDRRHPKPYRFQRCGGGLAANDFWTMEGHDRSIALNSFFEHLSLIAGLVLVSVISLQAQGETLHEASHDLQPSP